MKRRARLILILAVLGIVSGLMPSAWACRCLGEMSQDDYVKRADVVFVGVPVHKQPRRPWEEPRRYDTPYIYTFEVEDEVKGDPPERIEVQARDGGNVCGFRFKLGNRYRVYLHENGDRYSTGLCSGNESLGPSGRTMGAHPSSQPTSVSALGTPETVGTVNELEVGAMVADGVQSGSGFIAGFAAVTLATSAAALAFARRRRRR